MAKGRLRHPLAVPDRSSTPRRTSGVYDRPRTRLARLHSRRAVPAVSAPISFSMSSCTRWRCLWTPTGISSTRGLNPNGRGLAQGKNAQKAQLFQSQSPGGPKKLQNQALDQGRIQEGRRGRGAGRPGRQEAGCPATCGGSATSLRPSLRHRPLGRQRRCHGHDSPGACS